MPGHLPIASSARGRSQADQILLAAHREQGLIRYAMPYCYTVRMEGQNQDRNRAAPRCRTVCKPPLGTGFQDGFCNCSYTAVATRPNSPLPMPADSA